MRNIIYYVATSIDGYIAGPGEDISGFLPEGNGVEKYLNDLKGFDTVIMGRKTYEFGYKYGLKPGQPAYAHMQHYIFSNTLSFENASEKVHVYPPDLSIIKDLKNQEGTPIYLCGGGVFAGWTADSSMMPGSSAMAVAVTVSSGLRSYVQRNRLSKSAATPAPAIDR